jgi:two-component system, LuxR family, sensor kinase FixL
MPRRQGHPAQSALLILLTLSIFAVDAFTHLDTAIAVMYIVVLMMASSIWPRTATLALSVACVLLTMGAYLIAHGFTLHPSPAGRALVSIGAIEIATWLAVKRQETLDSLRQRQDALRRSEAFLAGAQRLTRTGAFGIRVPDGTMTWSCEAARIFGYARELEPTMERVLERTLPEDRAAVRAAFSRALACEGQIDFAHRLLLPGGLLRHVHVLAEVSHDEYGDCEYLGAITDITERVEAEQQLHASQIQLAHAARVSMLGELAASVAHEVNQPLTAILANAKAARRWLGRPEPDLPETMAALDGIVQASERASQVIRRIRALARRADPEHRPLDLNALVQETVELLQRELERSPLDLRVDLAPGLPEVVGDRVELQQVLINLIMNALQAMAATGATAGRGARLELRTHRDGDALRLTVRDSGPGIADADSARLFEPFFSTKSDGMGLGLSICRSIITKHGGQIGVRCTPPGSTFHVELPVSQETHAHEQ